MKYSEHMWYWILVVTSVILLLFGPVLFIGPQLAATDDELGQQVVEFIVGSGTLPGHFTHAEIDHLSDVRVLFQVISFVCAIALLVVLVSVQTQCVRANAYHVLWRALLTSGRTILLAVMVLVVFGSLSFTQSFTWFHKIFFPQGNWMFPSSSMLIQLYPIEYFQQFALLAAIASLLIAGVIVLISKKLLQTPNR